MPSKVHVKGSLELFTSYSIHTMTMFPSCSAFYPAATQSPSAQSHWTHTVMLPANHAGIVQLPAGKNAMQSEMPPPPNVEAEEKRREEAARLKRLRRAH